MLAEKIIIGLAAFGSTVATLDYNLAMAIIGILLAMVLAPRYFSNRSLRAENEQLNSALETVKKVKEADDLRIGQLEKELTGATARANAANEQAIELKGKYDALKPFTAEPAFRQVESILERMDERDSQTHELLRRLAGELSVLGGTAQAVDQNDTP